MVEEVMAAVVGAGRVIEAVRARGYEVEHKGSLGPVTEADRNADALLKQRLLGLEPCGWLSEETADDKSRLGKDRLWVVDPLDGTKEFVSGVPHYTVAVALVEAGEAVLAVVHNPSSGEMFWAERGRGAFKDGDPVRVAEGSELLASRSEVERGEFEPFMGSWTVTPMGSIEYKLALVAAGRAAATFSRGPKWEWDVCAGSLIVTEAGGVATDLFGAPLRFNQPFPKTRGILVGAPHAYRRARAQLATTGASDRMNEFEDDGAVGR